MAEPSRRTSGSDKMPAKCDRAAAHARHRTGEAHAQPEGLDMALPSRADTAAPMSPTQIHRKRSAIRQRVSANTSESLENRYNVR